MAVTSKFLVPGGIEWPVFGDQIDRENFGAPPTADLRTLCRVAIRIAGVLFENCLKETHSLSVVINGSS